MQFEHFDKKIREAADHHHPAYDEKAWEKMEKLLDKHLPQKKDDRRRIIFLILLFTLLGSGAWFFLSGPGHSDKMISSTSQKDQQTSVSSTTNNNPNNSAEDKGLSTSQPSVSKENGEKISQQKSTEEKTVSVIDRNKYTQSVVSMLNDRLQKTVRSNATSAKNKTSEKKQQTVVNDIPDNTSGTETSVDISGENASNKAVQNPVVADNSVTADKNISPIVNDATAKNQSVKTVNDNKQKDAGRKNTAPTTTATSDSKKQSAKNKKNSYFFLSVSAGPDVSAAGINSLGKLKPVYGVGLGFSFHDKFSLRTGFYSARKVYTASPDEYHPPYNFWTYYPYLKKVEADCRVFEIPLLLSYNFTHTNDHSIFGTAGISTYLMKRETYDYLSKLPSGQTTYKEVTINNKNKHFFSVLTLSGGYQRNLSRSISIAAEPYVKIPVDGIGFGKMQLNSAGVLFSLQVKPFKERKNK